MIDEGYVKFQCVWKEEALSLPFEYDSLCKIRDILHQRKLIGSYPDGVGYGNISQRVQQRQFLISGTQTGNLERFTKNHFALVTDYSVVNNSVMCKGLVKASSESLSHAALYEIDSSIGAVVHVHSKKYWESYLHRLPTTPKEVPYGTPQMATAIQDLFNSSDLSKVKILVMAGHAEGIIAFGENPANALETVLLHCK